MKKQFCKILLAVSFLFLVPALCMSQNLKGIWKLVQSEGSSQVVRYKVLDKDGNYFNVDAYIKDAVDVSSGSRSSDDVFCPYKVTTKKWNAEECSNRFDLQRFHLSCRLFPTPP